MNRSNVDRTTGPGARCAPTDPARHQLDYGDESYEKSVVGVETVFTW